MENITLIQWIVQQVILVLSIIISASLIIWQIKKQHDNSLKLQRQNKIAELDLAIYENIGDKIQKSLDEFIPVATRIHYSLPSLLASNRRLRNKGLRIGNELLLYKTDERGEVFGMIF